MKIYIRSDILQTGKFMLIMAPNKIPEIPDVYYEDSLPGYFIESPGSFDTDTQILEGPKHSHSEMILELGEDLVEKLENSPNQDYIVIFGKIKVVNDSGRYTRKLDMYTDKMREIPDEALKFIQNEYGLTTE